MKQAVAAAAMVSSSPTLLRGTSVSRRSRRSRSRVRRRSSLEEERGGGGEPSSPKVTCMGQIRSNKSNASDRNSTAMNLCCQHLKRALLCRKTSRSSSCRFFWCRRRERSAGADTSRETMTSAGDQMKRVFAGSVNQHGKDRDGFAVGCSVDEEGKDDNDTSNSNTAEAAAAMATAPTPPKNALLLMRCRSAPHNRSSAPALSRFATSDPAPAPSREGDDDEAGARESPRGAAGTTTVEDAGEEGGRRPSDDGSEPAGLTRCKSEPAKRAEKLMGASGLLQEGGDGEWSENWEGRAACNMIPRAV